MGKGALIRIIFSGIFALTALMGAIFLNLLGHPVPEWLITVIAAAAGYIFGHVQENGAH